jgi:hypothetical protein
LVSGNGVDRYPTKLTEDTFGPYIEHSFGYHTVDLIGPIDSFLMTAEVTDLSGVDTVLLNISGDVHELTESETRPDFYSVSVPVRGDLLKYYLWANDSLGNSFRTGLQWGYLSVSLYSSPSSNTTPTGPAVLQLDSLVLIGFGIVIAMTTLFFIRSYREANVKST